MKFPTTEYNILFNLNTDKINDKCENISKISEVFYYYTAFLNT